MALIGRIGKKGIALTVVAVLIIAGGTAYFLTHKKTETIKVTSTRSANTEKAQKKSSDQQSGSNNADNSTPPASDVPKSVPASTASLQKPYGTFVSNHHPNLGGSPAPSTEQSVCYTAPGASCHIEFTKGSLVKKLPAETADSSGSVTWNWDIKQAGLSTGSWTIKAVASLNGKTMSAQDDLNLEVQP
ncbi:MAG TPA: hypothetical protein VHA05_02245 [Candidatus Saccharimonadales bacterium]|nr:hypothetical protein [Candidatus Saccharimonadales bacterium]